MRGISSSVKEALGKIVEEMFDRMSVNLLGHIPALKHKKSILFSSNPTMTLAHLFVQALDSKNPLPKEEEALKNILSTAHEYIQSLKSKTKAGLSESIDSYIKEVRAKGETPSDKEIRGRINESLLSAGKHMKLISEAEATKARSMGKLMNIAKVGASLGQQDPSVIFVVVRDSVTCLDCMSIHMMSDGITPRVWKMSELQYSYHKKGENKPCVAGLHNNCRCSMVLLNRGFGFKNGKVSFISEGYDAYEDQKS